MSLLDPHRVSTALDRGLAPVVVGRVLRATGLVVEASLPGVPVGTGVEVATRDGRWVPGEVVGFAGPTALLILLGDMRGVSEGCRVRPHGLLGT